MEAMKLVLFDIDGTLVNCGPQVRPLFASALEEVFGTSGDVDGYAFAGRTDPRIVIDLMTAAGFSPREALAGLPKVRDLYLERLERSLERHGMTLLPAVEELLGRLAARDDVLLALLTGNWEPGARTKLSRFDLNRFFSFGAFGCDGIDRTELPPVALARAAVVAGRRFLPTDTLIVGDSIHDVSCGHAHGIPVLAVSTGRTRPDALREAGADWLIADLREAADAVPWLAG
jgi:phosphoglycolate phosphatase-like HAD superfamily hydrolase